MMAVRNVWSRSCGEGACFARKLAMTPSRIAVVVPVSRTVDQKGAVSKASTTAIEPPFASIA